MKLEMNPIFCLVPFLPPPTQGVPTGRGNCYIHNRQVYCYFQQFKPASRTLTTHPPTRRMCAYACVHCFTSLAT